MEISLKPLSRFRGPLLLADPGLRKSLHALRICFSLPCLALCLIQRGSARHDPKHFQIVQAPGYVVIEIEMQHHVRVIPLERTSAYAPKRPPVDGDARGRWEADTLVVDTSNFTDKNPFRGSFDGLQLVERFTCVDANTINYEFTVEDPATWTKPWRAAYPLRSLHSLMGGADQMQIPKMFECACHEGNYGLTGQLAGGRAVEWAADTASR